MMEHELAALFSPIVDEANRAFMDLPMFVRDSGSYIDSECSSDTGSIPLAVPYLGQHYKTFQPTRCQPCPDLVACYSSCSGDSLTIDDFPENHQFLSSDDTIHVQVWAQQTIYILLSEPLNSERQTHSRWLGQCNKRESFKASHVKSCNSSKICRLGFTAGDSWLGYRLATDIPLVCLNGHLAILMKQGTKTKFALSSRAPESLASQFTVAVSLIPVEATLWQQGSAYLTLTDCSEPLRFTRKRDRNMIG